MMNKSRKTRMIRFFGIVCWFLALFMLMQGNDEEKQEAGEAQNVIVSDMEEGAETDIDSTVIFPTED